MLNHLRRHLPYLSAMLLTGLLAGLGGMLLALLLHGIQHLAYGYSLDHIISEQSFLEGVSGSAPERRLLALGICGLIAGCGWYALYRFGKKLVSISAAVQSEQPNMPILATLAHILLQIVTVGLGSPLGREVAPRELGSLCANHLARWQRLSLDDTRVLIACGAGAGLAAVYNVPLAGALFVLEVLLVSYRWQWAISALTTSSLAAWVAQFGLGDEHQYHLTSQLAVNQSLILWALLASPLFGIAAHYFVRLTSQARQNAPKDRRLIPFNLLNFALLGALIIWLPQLAGNGKGPAELSFTNQLDLPLALTLLVCKVIFQWSSLRAGAHGGLLTPGLSNGALLAVILGYGWSTLFPGTPIASFALIGAGAFLATSMKMPITALVLVLEMTRVPHDFVIPLVLCIAGAGATHSLLQKRPS